MASTALATLTSKLAATLSMGDGAGLMETLKATAFKSSTQVTDAQMTALLVVANQYGLNPWTKEIYAFPDRNNGIVPVVGVDGWSRIINNHPQFDGMDFEQDAESCTCIIHRKDRSHPVKVTEYMAECRRANVGPWTSHPRRMLRHKAMIQCARLAFGYGGIYDQDEAERIAEVKTVDPATGEILTAPTFNVDAAIAAVKECQNEEALLSVWQEQGALAVAAKDKTGHAALKVAVKEKRESLGQPVQDVQSREVSHAAD
jgi:phage recombination protein Bet